MLPLACAYFPDQFPWRVVVFTGIDLIVIALVAATIFYATSPAKKSDPVKIEPLTLLVVIIVISMIVISLTTT